MCLWAFICVELGMLALCGEPERIAPNWRIVSNAGLRVTTGSARRAWRSPTLANEGQEAVLPAVGGAEARGGGEVLLRPADERRKVRFAPVTLDAKGEVTIAEAAELTGLTKRAIARRIERGGLPARRKQDGRRYVRVLDLAENGLLDLATGKPPPWRPEQIDPRALAREAVQTLIRQGIELNELRGRLEALEEESRQQDEALRGEIEQARRERSELRKQIERVRKQAS